LFNQVFEHIEEPGTALAAAERLLSRRGKIFVIVPNAASLRAHLSAPLMSRHFGFDERYRAFPIHLSYFTPITLRRILRKHGFRVDQLENFGLGLDELFLTEDGESDSAAGAPGPVRTLETPREWRREFGPKPEPVRTLETPREWRREFGPKRESVAASAGEPSDVRITLARKGARLFKKTVKEWLFGKGLGEYLMAVASSERLS
jgi:hypothetical protein